MSEANTVDKTTKDNPFQELIEESNQLSNMTDAPSISHSDENKTNEPSSPPPPTKPEISKKEITQKAIDQLLNFDISQLDSPPTKKVKL